MDAMTLLRRLREDDSPTDESVTRGRAALFNRINADAPRDERATTARRRFTVAGLGAVGAFAIVGALVATNLLGAAGGHGGAPTHAQPSAPVASGTPRTNPDGHLYDATALLERAGSTTASDWVKVADAVVTATVTGEERIPPPKSETTTGTGRDLIGRTITVAVDEILWTAPGATQTPPATFTMNASGWWGWMPGETDSRETPMGMSGSPRLEVGHSYVLALVWMRAECSEGDEPNPAGWTTIGSGGKLPADDGIIGQGEYEGSAISVEQSKRLDLTSGSLLAEHLGAKPSDIPKALDAVTGTTRIDFQGAFDNEC